MIENMNTFIKRQKNVITLMLLVTLMCWFIPYAKYIAIIIIPIYAFWFNKHKKILMSDIEQHFVKNHTEEYDEFKKHTRKVSVLDINIAPFTKSEYFVETMFDRVFIEKCNEANTVNFIVVIMIIGLAGTILLLS